MITAQTSTLPEVIYRPDLRSNSMMESPVKWMWVALPMVYRVSPNTTLVCRKSPVRIFNVDSMPVGMAP